MKGIRKRKEQPLTDLAVRPAGETGKKPTTAINIYLPQSLWPSDNA